MVGAVDEIPNQVVRANRAQRALQAQLRAQAQLEAEVRADSKPTRRAPGEPTSPNARRHTATSRPAARTAAFPDNALADRWERLATLLFESGPALVERLCREAQVGLDTVQAFEEAGLVRAFGGKVALTFDGLAAVVLNESGSPS